MESSSSTGDRVRSVRKRRGLTQRELARTAALSFATIKAIEQGKYADTRAETLRKLAAAMAVPTTELMPSAIRHDPGVPDDSMWGAAREAIIHPRAADTPEPVTERGLSDALQAAVRLYEGNRYERLSRALPALLADAQDAPPLLRSRALQLAGSVMVQTRQRDAARVALDTSLADAEYTGSELDSASSIITMCWLLLIEGRFEQVRHLAAEWADRIEPRFSTATVGEMSAWGWLLLRGSAAAIRDNRPDEAGDMIRLAEAAAVAAGREHGGGYHQYFTTFNLPTVAMKKVENALVGGHPDVALQLAREVPSGLRPTSDNRNRHLLDVSAAHLELRQYDDAFAVLRQLSGDAGPWLAEQRMARDLLGRIVDHRRTLTQDMRDLADAVRLPL